jgi:hypothetical protein
MSENDTVVQKEEEQAESIRTFILALKAAGVRQGAIADEAKVNGGGLSQFMSGKLSQGSATSMLQKLSRWQSNRISALQAFPAERSATNNLHERRPKRARVSAEACFLPRESGEHTGAATGAAGPSLQVVYSSTQPVNFCVGCFNPVYDTLFNQDNHDFVVGGTLDPARIRELYAQHALLHGGKAYLY